MLVTVNAEYCEPDSGRGVDVEITLSTSPPYRTYIDLSDKRIDGRGIKYSREAGSVCEHRLTDAAMGISRELYKLPTATRRGHDLPVSIIDDYMTRVYADCYSCKHRMLRALGQNCAAFVYTPRKDKHDA